jgi:replication-associated recombination protein RarA
MSLYQVKTVNGHNLTEVVSAFQKAVRRGQVDDALYWATDMYMTGYHEYCWKRMKVMASEDIGLADRHLPATLQALYQTFVELAKKKDKHQPEKLQFVHAVLLLATSPKSRMVDHALIHHFLKHKENRREIPDCALDKHTQRGKQMRRGFEHFFAEGAVLANEVGEDPYLELAKAALMGGRRQSPAHDDEAPEEVESSSSPGELF